MFFFKLIIASQILLKNCHFFYYQIFFIFQELTALLRTMGQNPTDSEVNDMINEVDVDGSGVLDFNEFLTFVKRLAKNRNNPENEIRETFRRYV